MKKYIIQGIFELMIGTALLGYVTGVSLALFLSSSAMPGIGVDGVFVTGLGLIAFVLIIGAVSFVGGFWNVWVATY